ncbi:hypothetical protein BAUCODRAFT_141556 [Baudoinia panamericana UAMH 10762]|uniref:Helicase ATP-binding domain-containing protein n=1 Tax=Baudoinia panamericana (strain UAMH 10762) TaxID=717646 RepID=M2MCD5_BAUPA|nr:uncharacterized protein BAUCODRAFT_141556 [Baudoinia panamericana UAMH 10762]EMC94186.1 hypothetical protein BAUCODRAFT_141556 [Baudoinia panamericana UAMH 10762]
MNEGLSERFGRSRNAIRPAGESAELWVLPPQLNLHVRQYFEDGKNPVDGGAWLERPEFPSSGEILDVDTNSSTSSDIVELVANKPVGAWQSKEVYLSAMYELLREDAVRPLRQAVSAVRGTPAASEDAFNSTIGIYTKVHICAITCSNRGLAHRVTFSLERVGKMIRWEQSKRLISGGIVALTPADDMFQKKAIIATVAARPLEVLMQNPPEIDLFIARAEEMELDPAVDWVMVENRSGFYEANRHTLTALQHMMREPFPLAEHLVSAQRNVPSPEYRLQHPVVDMTPVLRNNKHETYDNVDIVSRWPSQPSSDLDASQLAALRRILTKQLALIQGPPGCGKTFVSAKAVEVILKNRAPDDPPLIVACQTNHAVDQMLRKIGEFDKNFLRLGGRSKDKDIKENHTLHKIKQKNADNAVAGCLKPSATKKMRDLRKDIAIVLSPLEPKKVPLDYRMLEKIGLLTPKQADSLEAGASEWVQDNRTNPNEARTSPFTVWLGSTLTSVPPKQQPEEFGFEYEETDLAFEQLRELEAENTARDDEDFETLDGPSFTLADNFTCRKVTGVSEAKVQNHLQKEQNLWKIPEAVRGEVYRYLQAETKKHLLQSFREKAKQYNDQAARRKTGLWEENETVLKKHRIIGMTTTGFSKYRGLIAALKPKIVLIEEAAETLEPPVTVTALPSVQHLILVGDHRQLRPSCAVKALEDPQWAFNISLFERMVQNGLEFDILTKQRRMIPEVRRLLQPIYKNLIEDHASVKHSANRPDVPGMGGVNSFFFTHQWPEQLDDQMSAFNVDEAEMIVGFVEYLVYNGVETKDITILTFYNGQRKQFLSKLRQRPSLSGYTGPVVTVDSYQGEENKIVILSLVRSNNKLKIGFLSVDNRVCVALSRAQCGFYMFGNGNKGPKAEDRLKSEPLSRVSTTLPVRCSVHDNRTLIGSSTDWDKITGGCELKCTGTLPCGHACELTCHPFDHDVINCVQRCGRGVANITNAQPREHQLFDALEVVRSHASSNSDSWKSFAEEEPLRYAIAASAPPSQRASPEKRVSPTKTLAKPATKVSRRVELQPNLGIDGAASSTGGSRLGSMFIDDLATLSVSGDSSVKQSTKQVTVGANGKNTEREDWSNRASLLDD